VIVGHQGVGKTFLALKLAEFLALKTGNSLNPVHVLSLDQVPLLFTIYSGTHKL